jgi:hypothetical protein
MNRADLPDYVFEGSSKPAPAVKVLKRSRSMKVSSSRSFLIDSYSTLRRNTRPFLLFPASCLFFPDQNVAENRAAGSPMPVDSEVIASPASKKRLFVSASYSRLPQPFGWASTLLSSSALTFDAFFCRFVPIDSLPLLIFAFLQSELRGWNPFDNCQWRRSISDHYLDRRPHQRRPRPESTEANFRRCLLVRERGDHRRASCSVRNDRPGSDSGRNERAELSELLTSCGTRSLAGVPRGASRHIVQYAVGDLPPPLSPPRTASSVSRLWSTPSPIKDRCQDLSSIPHRPFLYTILVASSLPFSQYSAPPFAFFL